MKVPTMMCPQCRDVIQFKAEALEQAAECPHCGAGIRLHDPEYAAAKAAANTITITLPAAPDQGPVLKTKRTPPAAADAENEGEVEQLKLLYIFHCLAAALYLVAGYLVYLPFSHGREATSALREVGMTGDPGYRFILLWTGLTGAFAFGLWALALLTAMSAGCLRTRRRRFFSQIVAGLNCLAMPIGLVLGIFTLIVLQREPVKRLYLI